MFGTDWHSVHPATKLTGVLSALANLTGIWCTGVLSWIKKSAKYHCYDFVVFFCEKFENSKGLPFLSR